MSDDPRRQRRRSERRDQRHLRQRQALYSAGALVLFFAAIGIVLLTRFVTTLLTRPVAPRPVAEPLELAQGCSPGELVSYDSWSLARVERTPITAPRKQLWEASQGDRRALDAALHSRLRGWPTRLVVDPRSLPRGRRAFAERLAADTWRGLDALTDRFSGLPLDTIVLAPGERGAPPRGAIIGDYTNVTNVGLHLAAVVGAMDLGLLDARQAYTRLDQVLATLEGLETDRGFFFNYYDTTSLERTSHFVSFVDSGWLTAGLMVVRNAFPELAERCGALIARTDYGEMYDRGGDLMSHGYYLEPRARSRYHYGVLYTEARLGALIAIGKGDVPESVWFSMVRTFPPDCRWQSRTPVDVRTRDILGHRVTAGVYRWRGLRYVPSWGGSMFEALMPTILLDEQRAAPRSLGRNGVVHAVGQRRYARQVLRAPLWGFSPSSRPDSDAYGEFGVKPLGSLGYPAGPVTPHALGLALAVTPRPALDALWQLATRFRAYGEYGLYDAVDPRSGAVATKYLALDQSMLFLALVNYLTDGAVTRRFANDPIMQRVLPLIGAEDFFPTAWDAGGAVPSAVPVPAVPTPRAAALSAGG
ncbi:MAG: glucoamylase family protein [Deltaproteobacteria bacterium]|nr:glucoamylase family protein [Deltaproteobacteria bacterium]